MAYQGSESQEIGRSSDLKGKDFCRYEIDPVLRSKLLALDEKMKGSEIRRSSVKVHPCVDDSPHSDFGTVPTFGVYPLNQRLFKCILVGDGGTGKTTYLNWMFTREFEKKYEPTIGMHENLLEVPTKQGSTQFLCVDTPGHEKPGFPRDKYYEGADCAIIFCDTTAKQTQKDVSMWHEDLHRVCGDIPIVVCGNKVDLKKRQVKTKKVAFHMKYYEISAKSGYNLDKPFQYLAEKLAGYVEGANCI